MEINVCGCKPHPIQEITLRNDGKNSKFFFEKKTVLKMNSTQSSLWVI